MSTGLDCHFVEVNPNEWYYELERGRWTDDDLVGTGEYDKFGSFPTFGVASQHLHDNHVNPGGFSLKPHPDSTDETCPTWAKVKG